MALKGKKKQPEVVPVSVRTGKVIKRPRKGQQVNYAVRGIRGGLKILRPEAQEFFKTDLKGLNKIVSKSDKSTFVVYEQKLRKLARNSKGKIQYRTDAKGKKHKLYQTKLTYAKPRAKTKPVLYKSGKKLRALDLKFSEGNYKSKQMERELTLVKPGAKFITQKLSGKTIKDALRNIQVDVDMKQVRKQGFGVFYNVHAEVRGPSGEITKVPVSGEFTDNEFQATKRIQLKGKETIFGKSEVKIMANLQSAMARSIRYSLKNSGGYAFTKLTTLEKTEKRMKKKLDKIDKDFRKIKGQTKADKDARGKLIAKEEVLKSGIDNLYFGDKQKNFENKQTKLTLLKPGDVTIYVKFEVMDE